MYVRRKRQVIWPSTSSSCCFWCFTVVAVLYPLWFVVIASFSDPNAVAGGEVNLLPKGVTFVGYAKVFANHRIWQGYLNTIIYSVVGTAVNMAVTIPCAFALSRREFKPRRVIMFLFTVTMFVSGGLIPNYLLYKALGINNTMWVFILPGAVSVYNVIVARSFFETSIPEELHDAAQIDGLSYFGYFFKIVLPLSSAILAVIGLYYFVGHWNDFMTGLIYITDDTKAAVAGGLAAVAAGGCKVPVRTSTPRPNSRRPTRSSSASSSSPPCLCWCCTRSCRSTSTRASCWAPSRAD